MNKYEILRERFGFQNFKYPQGYIIDCVYEGVDVIGLLPTGFGKSIIYQVLSLMLDGLSIIISPLIALMEDQLFALRKKNIPAAILTSNLSLEEQETIYCGLMKNKFKILYVSPERLNNARFDDCIKYCTISMVVIDEAHTILWAEGFRQAFKDIGVFITKFKVRPKVLALTATATPLTIQKIKRILNLKNPLIIDVPMDRKNLFYKVVSIKDKFSYLCKYLKKHQNERGIIYCLTRRETENLHKKLLNCGLNTTYYHGGLPKEIKQENQLSFTKAEVNWMICTNAFGMGIDIPNIRFVLEYNLPQSLEDLVQQIGRASRDGKYGEGIVLFSFEDIRTIEYFIEQQEDPLIKKQHHQKKEALVDYCLTKKCRHQFIGKYFNQAFPKCQMMCDNCLK